MSKYIDENGVAHLLSRIKELINDDSSYQEVLVDLLEKILMEDKIQKIIKLNGIETIPASSSKSIRINCGFDAYEIKTIWADNTTSNKSFQIEILEDDTNNRVIFKSLMSSSFYTNTGGVCNIDEPNRKYVYLRFINPSPEEIDISYELKLLNLLVALPE